MTELKNLEKWASGKKQNNRIQPSYKIQNT